MKVFIFLYIFLYTHPRCVRVNSGSTERHNRGGDGRVKGPDHVSDASWLGN